MFRPAYLCEDYLGLRYGDRHEVIRWMDHRVFISYTRQGDALVCHFSADRKALRHLRSAIEEFSQWAFNRFAWCMMLIGCICRDSVVRFVKSCGFWHVEDQTEVKIYARYR